MAAQAIYWPSAQRAMRNCLADFAPDLAHLQGIDRHLSTSILWELKRRRIPVLCHLNDFSILCPTSHFVADGRACDERCRNGAFHHLVTRGCYQGPCSAAVALAAEAYLHKWLRTYERCVNLFLAPSDSVRDKLVAGGLPVRRIEVLPPFQVLPGDHQLAPNEGYLLYFGRLSPEKGVAELLRAMARRPHTPLVVAGDGPERPRLEGLAKELNLHRVLFAGAVHGEKLQKLIAGCSFSVFPSHAYETLGKPILESYAWGRPVVASDLGSRPNLVEHGVTGLLYPDGDREHFAQAMEFLLDRPDLIEKMGAAARKRAKTNHDPDQHLERLLGHYRRLTGTRKLLSFPAFPAPPEPPRRRQGVRVALIGGRGAGSGSNGMEAYCERAGHELSRLGHEITVYCHTSVAPQVSTHKGMRVRCLPTLRSRHLDAFVHTLLSTAHAMVSDCDVVHYHGPIPTLISVLPRLAGKKSVVTVQDLDRQSGKRGAIASRLLRAAEAAALGAPNATLVDSRRLQQYYRERYNRDTVYVPLGPASGPRRLPRQLREWDLLPDNYILFLGGVAPEKNCRLLVEAFENLHTDMKLVLAGGFDPADSFVASLRRRQGDRIRFLPWNSGENLEQLLSHAAVFVLRSDLGGLSLALLEAMATGVCVLSSDTRETLELGAVAGFTFKQGNPADLKRVLDLLVHNPDLRRRAAVRQWERIQSGYLWPAVARSIAAAYYNVLGWNPSEAPARDRIAQRRSAE
jgi:glycosyltransferase involved in cell wall biosynthesis